MKLSSTIIMAIFICSLAQAYEFKNFKVNKRRLQAMQTSQKSTSSPLMRRISELVGDHYQDIGQSESNNALLRHESINGLKNFSGLTWNIPTPNFNLHFKRTLSPHLYNEDWVVRDTLTIFIKASTVLSNFEEDGTIEIDQNQLAAFARLSYQRRYEYTHLASSYKEGLQSDYRKLFLNFLSWSQESLFNLNPYDFMKKVDTLAFHAGAGVSLPLNYGFSAQFGALAEYTMESTQTAQRPGNEEVKDGETLRLSSQTQSQFTGGVSASLAVDFFQLLKITLLQYDLIYEFEKSQKYYFHFYPEDYKRILSNNLAADEFKLLMKGKKLNELHYFKDRLRSLEQRRSHLLSSRLSAFIYVTETDSESEDVQIIQDDQIVNFYQYISTSSSYVQNIFSKIAGLVIEGILGFNLGTKKNLLKSKRFKLEYKKQSQNSSQLASKEYFSLDISQDFFTKNISKKSLKKKTFKFMSRWNLWNDDLVTALNNNQLKAPLSFSSKLIVTKKGLEHFLKISKQSIKYKIRNVCHSNRSCNDNLYRYFSDGHYHYKKYNKIEMVYFRRFFESYYRRSKNIKKLYDLFGKNNIAQNSYFKSKMPRGEFITYFKSGQYQGTNAINNYLREQQI